MALLLAAACKKKFELVPEGAKQVSRSDKTESNEDQADVFLREYKFTLANETFLCESREFADAKIAAAAAKKSIAERPEEEQQAPNARFALSGRSVWLYTDKHLVWCMLSSGKSGGAAMTPVKELFLKKFKEFS